MAGPTAAALLEEALVPGMQIAIIRDGRVDEVQALGIADVQTGEPVSARTVFEAGSLGKPVLAYAVLLLVSEGKIDLDAPAGASLPDLDPALGRLTPRMLLGHRGGLPNRAGGTLRPESPGTRFSYSGEGYRLLQRLVEKATGEPFQEHVRRAVFAPLGMEGSSYVWREDYAARKAFGHGHAGASAGRNRIPAASAQSSLETNAGDYARFLVAAASGEGLSPEARRLMTTAQSEVEQNCVECLGKARGPVSSSTAWSLGWGLERKGSRAMLWHWGDNGAMQAYAAIAADRSVGIVVLANSANGHSVIPPIARQILGFEAPGYSWLASYAPYSAPERMLLRRAVRKGVDSLSDAELSLSAAELRLVARRLLDARRAADAAALLERTAALRSPEAPDLVLLAEAKRRSRDLSGARAAIAAALAADPASEPATVEKGRIEMAARRMPTRLLRDYAGAYATPFGTMTIRLEGHQLVARLIDQPASDLLPFDQNRFLIEGMNLPIEFVRGPEGSVTHAVADAGGPVRLDKIG